MQKNMPLDVEALKGYYRVAADFWFKGVQLQVERCLQPASEARYDHNFLVVAASRLVTVAIEAQAAVPDQRLQMALDEFRRAQPELRDLRNYQEHLLDPTGLGSLMYFGSKLVRLRPYGQTEDVVDASRLLLDTESLHRRLCEVLGEVPEPSDTWHISYPDPDRRAKKIRHPRQLPDRSWDGQY